MESTTVELPFKISKHTDHIYCAHFGKLIFFFLLRFSSLKKKKSLFLEIHFLFDWISHYNLLYPVFAQQIIQK